MTVKSDPLVGKKLGRYQIETLLGRGKGASVYRASDPVFGRAVAIKVLDPAVARDPQAVAAFLRDAEVLARLSHPHILPIYEAAERDGVVYIARQHTDGGSLRGRLEQDGRLSVPEAIAMLRPIATALDYAHRQGFVHGNLRPSSILRTTAGQVFLTDFVVPGKEETTASAVTTVISAIDAPEYAAPEQARNITGVASIDLYVLGVIVYEVLTGRPPFQIDSPSDSARNVITRHLQAEPPTPRALNPALGPAIEAVLLRALAKRPEDRYPTGAALFYALGEAHEQDGNQARPQAHAASERPARGAARRASPVGTARLGPLPKPGRADGPMATPVPAPAEAIQPDLPMAQVVLHVPAAVEPSPPAAAPEVPAITLAVAAPVEVVVSEGEAPASPTATEEEVAIAEVTALPEPPAVEAHDVIVVPSQEANSGKQQQKPPQAESVTPPSPPPLAIPAALSEVLPEASQPVVVVQQPVADEPVAAARKPMPPPIVMPDVPALPAIGAAPARRQSSSSLIALVVGVVLVLGAVVIGGVMLLGRNGETVASGVPSTPTIVDLGAAPTVVADQPTAVPSAAPLAATTVPIAAALPTATTVAAASAAPAVVPPTATTAPVPTRQEVILFSSRRGSGPGSQIYAMAPDGKGLRPLAQVSGYAWGPRIAPDSHSFAFSNAPEDQADRSVTAGGLAAKGKHDLYLLNTDGSAPVRLTTTSTWNSGWSWSPDGKSLAFTSNRDGNWEIYTLTFPSGEITRLTTNVAQDAWPSWTPDGKRIVFMSARDGFPQLYSMNADGKNVVRLNFSESADTFPVVSPDGTKIAYVAQTPDSDESEIYVMDIDGANATRLTTTGGYNSQPTWSPDGKRLAFVSDRDGSSHIYVMRADGSAPTALTTGASEDVTPTWGYLYLTPTAIAPAERAGFPLSGSALGLALMVRPRRRTEPIC